MKMDKSQYKDVYVFVEQREGVIQKVAIELLGKARELADSLNEKWWRCCWVMKWRVRHRN